MDGCGIRVARRRQKIRSWCFHEASRGFRRRATRASPTGDFPRQFESGAHPPQSARRRPRRRDDDVDAGRDVVDDLFLVAYRGVRRRGPSDPPPRSRGAPRAIGLAPRGPGGASFGRSSSAGVPLVRGSGGRVSGHRRAQAERAAQPRRRRRRARRGQPPRGAAHGRRGLDARTVVRHRACDERPAGRTGLTPRLSLSAAGFTQVLGLACGLRRRLRRRLLRRSVQHRPTGLRRRAAPLLVRLSRARR